MAHAMLCTLLVPQQEHLRQARHPDLTPLSLCALCRIKPLVNEWHQGFGSRIVEPCVLYQLTYKNSTGVFFLRSAGLQTCKRCYEHVLLISASLYVWGGIQLLKHRCLVHVRCSQVSCTPSSCRSQRLLPLWYQPSAQRCHRCPTPSRATTEMVPRKLFLRSVSSGRDEGRLS